MKATTEMFGYNREENRMFCDLSTIQCNNCFNKDGSLDIKSSKTGIVYTFFPAGQIKHKGEIEGFLLKAKDIKMSVLLFND